MFKELATLLFPSSFHPAGAAKQLLHVLRWPEAELVHDVWFRKGFNGLLQRGEQRKKTLSDIERGTQIFWS